MGLDPARYLECSLPKDNARIKSPTPRKMASKKKLSIHTCVDRVLIPQIPPLIKNRLKFIGIRLSLLREQCVILDTW
jgi:hypothetical protein